MKQLEDGFVDRDVTQITTDRSLYSSRPKDKEETSAEDIVASLQRRHGNYEAEEEYSDGEDADGSIKQQSLLPSVKDPKLWMVKCKVAFRI